MLVDARAGCADAPVVAAGLSPEAVHRSAGTRLSTGASQATERIAWTPYSRKAIAIAEARSERNGSDRIDCDDLLIGLAQSAAESLRTS
ncbi:hypothetical protein ACWCQW_55570 [Streptomyces mirabilis]